MFSAVFMATFAEGIDSGARESFDAEVKSAAGAITDVNLAAPVLEPPMPGGDYFCELGFRDQAAFEQAKAAESWATLYGLFENESIVAGFEYVAYGDGTLTLQETSVSKCHRVLIFSLLDDADPDMVAKMEANMNGMTDHVPGLKNCTFAKIAESAGSDSWAYAYECDFDEPGSFLGKYMTTPYHFCYIDKFFEPACDEWIVNPNLCTPYVAQETPFLANFAE
ncbi:Dabb family protein [Raoultibacter phocaeensis]|uniref:Dabb family protein n=1 Tax=Raoultibacter phocaeensis TaxID=2479841 RepID=UPI001117F616|nr:Dabb family protein [Raoultibacter phocaeensis]